MSEGPCSYELGPLPYEQDPLSDERGPLFYERGPLFYERGSPSYERGPPSYEQGPPTYERAPPSHERGPPSYFKCWIVTFVPVTDTSSHCNGFKLLNRFFAPEKGRSRGRLWTGVVLTNLWGKSIYANYHVCPCVALHPNPRIFFSSLLLPSLELSDKTVYEPEIRARLGTEYQPPTSDC